MCARAGFALQYLTATTTTTKTITTESNSDCVTLSRDIKTTTTTVVFDVYEYLHDMPCKMAENILTTTNNIIFLQSTIITTLDKNNKIITITTKTSSISL